MQLTTERLRIIPLTPAQLQLWAEGSAALGRELQCAGPAAPLADGFRQIVEGQRIAAAGDTANHLFYTFWLLVTHPGGIIVGSACFKGAPSTGGEVEIGYGLEKSHEKQGYMAEAVAALCRWALRQPGVRHIMAETDPENSASQRILQRTGFSPIRPGDMQWWKL